MSGWTARVGGDFPGMKFTTPTFDGCVCNDGNFGECSISDCDEPFTTPHMSTERVVLLHAALSNKGTIFLYTFQPLFFSYSLL